LGGEGKRKRRGRDEMKEGKRRKGEEKNGMGTVKKEEEQ